MAETWLRFPEIKDTKMMNDLLAKTLNADYNRWTSKEVARALKDMDNSRISWANEDPTSTDIPIVEEVPTAILELLQPQTSGKVVKNFTFQKTLSTGTCQASDDTGLWQLRASVPDVTKLDLAMVRLDLQSLTANLPSLEQWTVRILETSNS
jgi:hypothetical protein